MTFAQYCRIESSVGGCACTNKQFIKGCLFLLSPQAKHQHQHREARHAFIRAGLDYLNNSKQFMVNYKL